MFYDRFISLCEEKGMRPTHVALEVGISPSTPTNWKKTGYSPNTATLTKLADYFGTSKDYILGLTDNKTTPNKADAVMTNNPTEALAHYLFLKLGRAPKLDELLIFDSLVEQVVYKA